jgi:hydrogenase-4 component F
MFHVFISMMIFVFLSDNLIIVWIAVEGTTLSSAFLVAFYNKKPAMEAAWKFIIVCSAGIVIALFGTIIMNLNSNVNIGETLLALNWTTLMTNASLLDPGLLRLAFILIFVGYATKVGLVPMHTWLPDAHSQAPSPVSATLSGVLLNTAVYAILRYHAVAVRANLTFYGFGFSNALMMIFGLLSILIPSGFMLVTKDYKRLLAYSSIKHMGMIMMGFGVGNFAGTLALFGALFHVLNHSLTKSMLFFTTGNILLKYKTRNMPDIKGLGYTMPVTAMLFMVGAFALTGLPPFAVFVSEISILSGMVNAAMVNPVFFIPVIIYVLCMVLVFAGFISSAGKMVLGKPENLKNEQDNCNDEHHATDWHAAPGESHEAMKPGEVHRVGVVIIAGMLVALILLGLFMPG